MKKSQDTNMPEPMPQMPDNGTVRSQVSQRTRHFHEALHLNPTMDRLVCATLSEAEYQTVLMRYLAFFIAAESRRVTLNCFPGHSLMPDISLLSADTGFIPDDLPRLHLVTDKWSCLGMLYVLHGARFGAKLMQTNLCARFPELPHHYFAQEQTPSQWRLIVMQMERASQSPLQIDALAQSAAETYALFDQWMSRPA